MKTFTQTLSIAVLALVSLGSAIPAHAEDEPRLTPFFQTIAGLYDGKGTVRQILASGGMQIINYTMRINAEKGTQDNTWTVTNQLTTDTGNTLQNSATFTVNGDTLVVSNSTGAEVVQVMDASPTSLTYKYQRVDVITGRPYDFTYHTELDTASGKLTGHNTIVTNGIIVSDEVFTATKW